MALVASANRVKAKAKASFRERPHLFDRAAAFVPMEVLYPPDRPQESWVVSPAASPTTTRRLARRHADLTSHRGIPKGSK